MTVCVCSATTTKTQITLKRRRVQVTILTVSDVRRSIINNEQWPHSQKVSPPFRPLQARTDRGERVGANARARTRLRFRMAALSCTRRWLLGLSTALSSPMHRAFADTAAPALRQLQATDAPAAAALIHGEGIGWDQTEDDLRRAFGEGGGLGVFDTGGELRSMAVLNKVGKASGWLSYVATAPSARRRGYARLLVERLLAACPEDFACGLYSSELGGPLYASLGFVDQGSAQLVALSAASLGPGVTGSSGRSTAGLVRATDALPQLLALDAAVYGTDRSAMLTDWSLHPASWVLPSADGRSALGYVLGRPTFPEGAFIGPIVASDVQAAERLLCAAIGSATSSGCSQFQSLIPSICPQPADGSSFADGCSDSGASDGLLLVERMGFERLGSAARLMVRGGPSLPPWCATMLPSARVAGVARPFAATGFEFG